MFITQEVMLRLLKYLFITANIMTKSAGYLFQCKHFSEKTIFVSRLLSMKNATVLKESGLSSTVLSGKARFIPFLINDLFNGSGKLRLIPYVINDISNSSGKASFMPYVINDKF